MANFLTIEPTSISVDMGKRIQLKAFFNEDGFIRHDIQINWHSKNPEIVSISPKGLATGIKPGSALIIAQAKGEQSSSIVSVKHAITELNKKENESLVVEEIKEDQIAITPSNKKDTFTSSQHKEQQHLPITLSFFDSLAEEPQKKSIKLALSASELYKIMEVLASEEVHIKEVSTNISQDNHVHSNLNESKRAISITLSISFNNSQES